MAMAMVLVLVITTIDEGGVTTMSIHQPVVGVAVPAAITPATTATNTPTNMSATTATNTLELGPVPRLRMGTLIAGLAANEGAGVLRSAHPDWWRL